ncbi:polysaccharide biosynthesis tyrosine autokinase [Planctomicrobium sp. SH664]|uniref:polysaccharide biosynthesis tyrosine autokinase n=1 Tax=Planctomicrobium sp. SH664 TaxID=3448125 RepID=UPI003F5B1F47
MAVPENHPPREAEFDFTPLGGNPAAAGIPIDIVRFVLSIWRPLAIGLCLGLLAGVGVYKYLGPVYSASTRVLVSKRASVPLNDGEANRYGERGDHVQLIQTDLIVERAFKDHGLDQIPQLVNAYDPLKEITEGLKVSRSAGQESSFDNILDIAYLHPNKEIAQKVVQAMVESYRDYLDDTKDANAQQLYKTLLERQEKLAEDVRTQEADYQKFRQAAPVFLKASPVVTVNGMPAPAQNQYEAELAALEAAQNENMRKRSSIQARLATLDRKRQEKTSREALEFWVLHSLSTGTSGGGGGTGSGGGVNLTASPEKASLDQQLLTARLLEQRLLHSLGEKHSSVRNVRGQIQTILNEYARHGLTPPPNTVTGENTPAADPKRLDLVSVYRDTLEGQLKELEVDNENLALLHDDAQKKAKEAEMFEIEDQRRKDQIGRLKLQLEQLYNQIAAYDVSREGEGYRLQQISQVRIERSLKRVIKLVATFGILGVAVVFCLSYLREWLDTTLKSLDSIKQFTGSPLLGVVPKFSSSADADRIARERGLSPALCYFHRPGSREAEAFRSIRTTLFVAMQQGQQIIQFSSPEPGDGKSTAAANLAIAIAQSGKSVLLLDCDLRRPTQHQLFRTEQEIGVTDVLLNEIDWENAIRPTPIQGLSLLTSGLCPENPAEILSMTSLETLLRHLRERFDLIVIDSPPVLAVSDPCIIAPHVDGMLLMVRMKKTKRAAVRRALETLSSHGIRVYGIVANGFDASTSSDSSYDYDTYGSYYDEPASGSSRPKSVAPRKPSERALL